jgi:AbrB family looped-hinge helix DNA binding protein
VGSPLDRAGSRLFLVALFGNSWHNLFMNATVLLGRQGRLVIPAEVRSALELVPGDRLHLQVSGRRLVLERQDDAVAELRGLASGVSKTRSLVDELLEERRIAATSE